MNDNDFLKKSEETISIEVDYVLKNLEKLAEKECLEFDWVVLEFRKQFNIKTRRKLEERGFEE